MRRDDRTADLFATVLPLAARPGALAGLKTQIAHMMSAAIRNTHRDRHDIAAAMSVLLGEDVPKSMLDAYTAESRLDQNVPAYRLLAFVAATDGYAELDMVLRSMGCALLVGAEARVAQLGELELQRQSLDQRIRDLRRNLRGGHR